MAGIYLHIPFCKTRCIYCDFYSTTRSDQKERYIRALCKELEERKDYLKGEKVETVYWGGGTPSQLEGKDFEQLFKTLDTHYGLGHCKEITLEANPDDLTDDYTRMLSSLPFNRISMGIQTFDDPTLRLLKRRHDSRTAIEAVDRCRKAGFQNISIDLIYGLPGETRQRWENDLRQAIALGVEHLSAYHLTYEENTLLYRMRKQHQVKEVDEDTSLELFALLTKRLQEAGFEHYEISNFCRPGKYSLHNSAYWKGIPYLGGGPSAHSFDGETREWNTASLSAYLKGMESGTRSYETEQLDTDTRYNEFIITTLRTRWGTPLEKLRQTFGEERYRYCLKMAAPYLAGGTLEEQEGILRLTRKGIFISDTIMSDLLWV